MITLYWPFKQDPLTIKAPDGYYLGAWRFKQKGIVLEYNRIIH